MEISEKFWRKYRVETNQNLSGLISCRQLLSDSVTLLAMSFQEVVLYLEIIVIRLLEIRWRKVAQKFFSLETDFANIGLMWKIFFKKFFSHFLSIRKPWERKHYLKSRYVGMVIIPQYIHMVYSNIVIL